MTLFLLGFCLVLFDLNITLHAASVGVFPDALGYLLMLAALRGRAPQSAHADRFKRAAMLGAIVTLVSYALGLAGAPAWAHGWIWVSVDLICFDWECYTGLLVIRLLRDADISPLKAVSVKLRSCYRLSVVFGAISFLGVISPASAPLLSGMSAVADLYFVTMCFKSAPQCVLFS